MVAPAGPHDVEVVEWDRSRLGALHGLVAAALPDEGLLAEDLDGVCFDGTWPDDGHSLVLAAADGTGAVSVVSRPGLSGLEAFVNLLVVHPDARRRGVGSALVEQAGSAATAWGARRLRLAGAAPFYLWPGVDERWGPARAFARARGFDEEGTAQDMALASSTRAEPPAGVVCRPVLDDADASAVRALTRREWPQWIPELDRGIESATCIAAFDGDAPGDRALGFCCHSVNRYGWLGPVGTDPAFGGRGIGSALVGLVCRDLQIAGVATVEVCWIGPEAFYASLGGSISRTYRLLTRPLSPPA